MVDDTTLATALRDNARWGITPELARMAAAALDAQAARIAEQDALIAKLNAGIDQVAAYVESRRAQNARETEAILKALDERLKGHPHD